MRTAGVAQPASLARLEREVETLAMDLAVLEELQQRKAWVLLWICAETSEEKFVQDSRIENDKEIDGEQKKERQGSRASIGGCTAST